MHYRTIEKSGVVLSEIGLGCNRLGGVEQPDSFWIELIRRAVDLGVNIFDTAESYSGGRSEEMLGLALGDRDDVFIATKVGRGDGDGWTAEGIVRRVEGNLRRLRRSRIDFLQLHSPGRADMERYDWAEGMARLQEQGKLRYRAMAVDSVADAVWLIKQDLVDLLQITYNIFDIGAEEELFQVAEDHGVGLMCRLTLAQGVLTGKFHAGQHVSADHRANISGADRLQERIEMAEDLRPIGAAYPGGMTRLAHHFSLTPRAITTIIPGARTVAQLEENVAASNGVGLGAAERGQIEALRPGWGEWVGGYWNPPAK